MVDIIVPATGGSGGTPAPHTHGQADLTDLEATDVAQFAAVALAGVATGTALRWCGRRSGFGAPTVGTWQTNDVLVDDSGVLWICSAGGTPGTWSYGVGSHGNAHTPAGNDPAIVALATVKGSEQTNATTTMADVTDLGITTPASGSYDFRFVIPWSSSITGNGLALQLKSSGAPTFSALGYVLRIQNTTTTHNTWWDSTYASPHSNGTAGAAGSNYVAEIFGRLTVTAAGVLVPQFAIGTGSASTVTVRAGAYGQLTKVGN